MTPHIVTGSSVSVFVNGKMHVFSDGHPDYTKVRDAIRNQDWDAVPDLVDLPAYIARYSKGLIEVNDAQVLYAGKPLNNAVCDKMLAMMRDGFGIAPLANFLEKLLQNPSKHAVDELFGFLEVNGLPIYEDGDFGIIRIVNSAGWDKHTGKTYFHEVGAVLKAPRNEVDDNWRLLCSSGIHAMSPGYASGWHNHGDRVFWCRVHPKDVVAVPSAGYESKMRVCEITVVEEITIESIRDRYGVQVVKAAEPCCGCCDEPEPRAFGLEIDLAAMDEDGGYHTATVQTGLQSEEHGDGRGVDDDEQANDWVDDYIESDNACWDGAAIDVTTIRVKAVRRYHA